MLQIDARESACVTIRFDDDVRGQAAFEPAAEHGRRSHSSVAMAHDRCGVEVWLVADALKHFRKRAAPGPQIYVYCDLIRRSGSHVSDLINVP